MPTCPWRHTHANALDVAEVQDINRLLTQDAEAQLAAGSMQ